MKKLCNGLGLSFYQKLFDFAASFGPPCHAVNIDSFP